jgi:hypothetical protein
MQINNSIIRIVGLIGGLEKKVAKKQYESFINKGYFKDDGPIDLNGNKDIRGQQFLRDYFYPEFRKIMFLDDTNNGISRFVNTNPLKVNLVYGSNEKQKKYSVEILQSEIYCFEGHIGLFSLSINTKPIFNFDDASNITSIIRNFDTNVEGGGYWHEWVSENVLCGIRLRGENVKADDFSGSKFKLYSVFDIEQENPTDNRLLFDLATCSPIGSASGLIQGLTPNESYYNKILENKVSVFQNWEALALFDTFTCIGNGQLQGFNYKTWDYTYFRIYLYRLFFKYNLYRYNSDIFEEKQSAIKLRNQFETFLNRYNISHVSFNFLGNEIYTRIGKALELDHELDKFRIRITNLSDAIQEERQNKTNILLQIVTVLGGISSVGPVLEGVEHFKEQLGFSTLVFYAIASILVVLLTIGVLYFIVPYELKKAWKKIKSIFR